MVFSTKSGRHSGPLQARLSVNVGDQEDAIEARVIADSLFIRVDVGRILGSLGNEALVEQAGSKATWRDRRFLEAALDGRWLKLPGIDRLASAIMGGRPREDPEQTHDSFMPGLIEDVKDKAEARYVDEWGHEWGPGDRVAIMMRLRDLHALMADLLEEVGGGYARTFLPPLQEGANEIVEIDSWLEDDVISQVEFDFLQLEQRIGARFPQGVDRLRLRLWVNEFGADVAPPEGAVEVDRKTLSGLVGALRRLAPDDSDLESRMGPKRASSGAPGDVPRVWVA